MTNTNPLNQFFRQIDSYITLPSGGHYYDNNVIDLDESGEIGVMAMTSKDELALKNPDALLNGKAVCAMLKNCVPSLKNPEKLLQNDLEAIIIAIRKASYGDDMDFFVDCPECEHENKYTLSLSAVQATSTELEPEYAAEIRKNLKVFIRPYNYANQVQASKIAFEQMKIARSVEDASEDAKYEAYTKSFDKVANLNFDLVCDSIIGIEAEGIPEKVTNKKHIKEFMSNISVQEESIIENLIKEINQIGVDKDIKVKCDNCGHVWETTTSFEPTTFFTKS